MTTNTGFTAGAEELTYNFEPYLEGVKGTIPEPSTQQIERLIEFLRTVMPTKQGDDGKTQIDLAKVSELFEGQDSAQVEALVNGELSAVCSGVFTAEQISALPFRVKQRFYGWLLGSLLSPEA